MAPSPALAKPRRRARPSLVIAVCIAAGAVLASAYFARYTLASFFGDWDDEGYMLISLRSYLAGHPLYSQTFTEYGPFHFLAQGLVFGLLHLPVTHDAGRLVTFLEWMLASALGGGFLYRMSRSVLLASSAFTGCLVLGSVLAKEPGHPQQIVLPLFLLAAFLAPGPASRFNFLRLFGLAAVGAALVFTKINYGAFYLFALAHTCLALLPAGRIRKVFLGLTTAAAAALPYALMHSNLGAVRHLWLFATPCLLAMFAMNWLAQAAPALSWRAVAWCVWGGLLATSVIVTATLLHGVSPGWLIAGVILEPARHPSVLLTPWNVRREMLAGMLVLLACMTAIGWLSLRGRLKAYADLIGALPGAGGLLSALILVSSQLGWAPGVPGNLGWALALLPLSLIPGRGGDWRALFPRLFLANLAAAQLLGIYPVAGSQLAVAAVPALLWAFVCVVDGSPVLVQALRRVAPVSRSTLLRSAALLLLAAFGLTEWREGFRPFHYSNPPSKLAGMHSVHLPPELENRYEFVTASVRANCDLLFSVPGLASFHFWSGIPAPNDSNLGPWVRALSLDKQQRILDILKAHPRACVISNSELLEGWHVSLKALSTYPLGQYILQMPVVVKSGHYEIHVAERRDAPWIAVSPASGGAPGENPTARQKP